MKFFRMLLIILLSVSALLALAVYGFMQLPSFGAHPDGARLERIKQSPNYRDGVFQNLSPTEVMVANASYTDMIRDYINKPADTRPPKPVPAVRTDLNTIADSVPTIVWFGHSSYLIAYRGKRILVDPVFSGYAAPVHFGNIGKAFDATHTYTAQDMPPIDMLIITHDHYDHLDYESIKILAPQCKHIYTSLGVGAHLEYWGIDTKKITEFDWWESHNVAEHIIPQTRLTAVPARHFSGRGIVRGKTLWSAFMIELDGTTILIGGDSGYDTHFKEIGKRFPAIDFALIENGQYGKGWPLIHGTPEEGIQAALDMNVHVAMPAHWAKFELSMHPWTDPIRRFVRSAQSHNQAIITPRIGMPVQIHKHTAKPDFMPPADMWWE